MKIIAGLGNPGKAYVETRHNIGFMAIDLLSSRHQISTIRLRHKALTGEGMIGNHKVTLLKPQTFMNRSGESLLSIMQFYKLTPSDFIVVYDDASLPCGMLRIRTKGSDGGHKGIRSIIHSFGCDSFTRVKVGISEKPQQWDMADYVLSKFSQNERPIVNEAVVRAGDAVYDILANGTQYAMNHYNIKVLSGEDKEENDAKNNAGNNQS